MTVEDRKTYKYMYLVPQEKYIKMVADKKKSSSQNKVKKGNNQEVNVTQKNIVNCNAKSARKKKQSSTKKPVSPNNGGGGGAIKKKRAALASTIAHVTTVQPELNERVNRDESIKKINEVVPKADVVVVPEQRESPIPLTSPSVSHATASPKSGLAEVVEKLPPMNKKRIKGRQSGALFKKQIQKKLSMPKRKKVLSVEAPAGAGSVRKMIDKFDRPAETDTDSEAVSDQQMGRGSIVRKKKKKTVKSAPSSKLKNDWYVLYN